MLRSSEPYAVYIISNVHCTTFYIGVTGNLHQRIWQHKTGYFGGFTYKYNCHHLLYFETYTDVKQAIAREKNLKNWRRDWKINLVKQKNPELRDLAAGWYAKNYFGTRCRDVSMTVNSGTVMLNLFQHLLPYTGTPKITGDAATSA